MKNIVRIIRLAKPLKMLFVSISLLITLGALIDLVMPLLFKVIVDVLTSNKATWNGFEDLFSYPVGYVIQLLVLMYVVNLAGQALNNISSRLGDHFAGKLRKYLTETFYDKALTLSQTYYDGELSGKIINQLNRGVQVISDFFNTATNFILPSFLQACFTILVLSYYDLTISVFVMLLFPIYIYISAISTKKWAKYQSERNVYEDKVRGRLSETILNIRLVRGFNNQNHERRFIADGLTSSNKYFAKQSNTFHKYDFIRNAGLHTILLAIFVVSFLKTLEGQSTIGELILIIQLVNQVRRPLFAMSFVLGRIQEAETGSSEYFKILDLPSREQLSFEKKPKVLASHEVIFDHVSFAYESDRTVIHDVSFSLAKNEVVALVGKSGAGKTTITNLLMKFYDPTSGDIRMGGESYTQLTTTDVRHHIALVFQEQELFSTSIRENVSYGKSATDEEVRQALVHANAWDFVKDLPQGIQSEVGERGVRLSGGQKQRIQIARAILRNAPILILDEATSSLDAQSEALIQEALENLTKHRTVLIIAHRFSTIQNADRILVIDKGKLIDQGTPKELSSREGIYQDLLQFQVEGNKKLLESFELY